MASGSSSNNNGRSAVGPNILFRKSSRRQQQIYHDQSLALSPPSLSTLAEGQVGGDAGGSQQAVVTPGGRRTSMAIGNNLRKRLSMRYAEPTALGPGGLSAVPQMPTMPSQYSGAAAGQGLNGEGGYSEDAGMAGIGLRAGRGLAPSASALDRIHLSPSAEPGSSRPRSDARYHDIGASTSSPALDGGLQGYDVGDGAAALDAHRHDHTAGLPELARPSNDRRRDPDAARRGGGSWERLERFARNPAVDLNLLTQSKFDPEAYLRATLNSHSEEALRDFQTTLESTQAAAGSDLRRTIFRNYKDFINISKEVSTLENDMLELKELLAEWRHLPEALQLVDSQTGLPKQRKGSRALGLADAASEAAKSSATGSSAASHFKAGSQLSRLINELTDDLAVMIALREWENAALLVEKGKKTLAEFSHSDPAYLDLSTKLSRRINELVSAVSLSLSSPLSKKSIIVSNASIMLRLGQGEKARELFLEARTELLRRRTRMIKFEGDVGLYISELALVYFTLIKNTSEWYMSAFKDNWMASGYVKWAAVQIQAYAEIFRRQVYGVADQDRRVIQEALEITRSSSAQLKEVGLDFGFLIEDLLRPAESGRPIPSLTLTLADDTMSSAHGHRSSFISNSSATAVARPTGNLISAQERRRTIMLAAGSVLPG